MLVWDHEIEPMKFKAKYPRKEEPESLAIQYGRLSFRLIFSGRCSYVFMRQQPAGIIRLTVLRPSDTSP